jgi:hypothetical protein
MKRLFLGLLSGALTVVFGLPVSAHAVATPLGSSTRTSSTTTTFRLSPAPGTGAAQPLATIIITCVSAVDNVHWSSGTGLPNVHARVSCDHATYSITSQVVLYRDATQVGSNGNGASVYGKTGIDVTANAAQRICGHNYHGEMGYYIVAPPGYSPPSAQGWRSGATSFLACGSCGRATPGSVSSANVVTAVMRKQPAVVRPAC